MARLSQEEFKAMQLEMMARYPQPQQPAPVHSHYSLGEQPEYAQSVESRERQQAQTEPQEYGEPYYIGPGQRRLETGYTWPEERKYHKKKDKRSGQRHLGECVRDCALLVAVIALFALLVVWSINNGYFGGGKKGEESGMLKVEDSNGEASPDGPLPIGQYVSKAEGILPVDKVEEAPRKRRPSEPKDIATTAPEATMDTDTSAETLPTEPAIPSMPPSQSPHKSPSPLKEPGDKVKFIVDVDPGVDDAMALSLALTSKRASLEAITVVAGNTLLENAYSNTLRVMKVIGRDDVPVYKGADRPITGLWETEPTFFGPDNFGGASGKYQPADVKAMDKVAHIAIRDMIRQRPKELTMVLLGPLTNMAIAMLMEPNLTDDVAHIVILGGNHKGSGNVKEAAEFNFFSDPVAARVVLQRATCPVTIVPWETLEHDMLPWDVYRELTGKRTTMGKFLLDITNHTAHCCSSPTGPGFVLGDFLAVLAALYPESVNATLSKRVEVELQGFYTMGLMVVASLPQHLPHIKHKVTIIDSFRIEKAVEVFREVFDVDG